MLKSIIVLTIFSINILQQNDDRSAYIGKISWHVGIILKTSDVIPHIKSFENFNDFNFVDIGWGDEEFYQSDEEFDLYLAAKAILVPTPSVIRVQGYNNLIDEIKDRRDYFVEIKLNNIQFLQLCEFIEKSLKKDENDEVLLAQEKFGGIIQYYKSVKRYHIGYTCNTWVADALKQSGLDVKPSNVITADELLYELAKVGHIKKYEN